MIAEKQFQRGAACFVNFLGFAFYNHPGHRFGRAGRHKLAVDFHNACKAGSLRAAFLQVAECGDIDAELSRAIENALAGLQPNVVAIYSNRNCSWITHSAQLNDLDCTMRAKLTARIAPNAEIHIDFMPLIRSRRYGLNGTMLSANRATDAIVLDSIFNQSAAFARRASALKMSFVFIAKIFESRQHRIWRRLAKPAKASSSHLPR